MTTTSIGAATAPAYTSAVKAQVSSTQKATRFSGTADRFIKAGVKSAASKNMFLLDWASQAFHLVAIPFSWAYHHLIAGPVSWAGDLASRGFDFLRGLF